MKKHHSTGFITVPMVTFTALFLILGVSMIFKAGLMRRDQVAKSQLRLDYQHREDAILRALVAIFPRKAIACMKGDYAPSPDYSWQAVFAEASAAAAATEGLDPSTLSNLGLSHARLANGGDHTSGEVASYITSLTGRPGEMTPGTTAYAGVFSSAGLTAKVPPLLQAPASLEAADALYPIVSTGKVYAAQSPGLLADINYYPGHNLIPYPPIHFGYAVPGQPFVAKKSWWAFSIHYGAAAAGGAAATPGVTRHYILSLYEIPSQLPIEGRAFTSIGHHQDGTAWNAANVRITGAVYGDSLSVNGTYGADRLSGRKAIEISAPVSLQGMRLSGNFDALGQRELLRVQSGSSALPITLSANSGRVVFFPLGAGTSFLNRSTVPPTQWDTYVGGARNCQVIVEAVSMASIDNQTPTSIRVRYARADGATGEWVLTRGLNWPTAIEPGGDQIPFQTELTNSNRACLTFYPSRLNAQLQLQGGLPVSTNNCVYFGTDPSADPLTVRAVSSPPAEADMSVIVRQAKNLNEYTKGLAVITPLRVYVGDDLNTTPAAAPPPGSGLASNAEFYPPMAIFSAEVRIGTTAFNRPMEHHGQIGTLATGETTVWNPLDVKSGTDDVIHADTMTADLAPLRSPADLPPAFQRNWLIIIEEIHQD
ncbi:MAG: hypothetical protein EOP86_01360 [Verrucomicrobiaceae bacterium]|nr:MAG: hypothetical protein EOP86_01360 [Verrucomicrobiaceae bacterium]